MIATLPKLGEVTLVAATSVAVSATVGALRRSMQQLEFGAVKLFTDRPVPGLEGSQIEVVTIAPLTSREAYSRFILHDLARSIETSHVMVTQWDGFVVDGARWTDQFLEFDYVGAPWPQFDDNMDVGNGGFSLRSRRLLTALGQFAVPADLAEDLVIGRVLRPDLERLGMRFADRKTASSFAFERTRRRGDELGFHGAFNLPDLFTRGELAALLAEIPAGLINRRDCRTMAARCLLRADFANAARLIEHFLRAS